MSENAKEDYSDRVDVTFEISLYEYGIVRNPKTGYVVYTRPKLDNTDSDNPKDYYWDYTIVELEDVVEALNEISSGYFDFVGQTKEEILANLSNEYLTGEIFSINQ